MYNKRTALQVRAGQRSITANIWPLTAHIYHKIISDWWLFQEIFLLLLFLLHKNSFE